MTRRMITTIGEDGEVLILLVELVSLFMIPFGSYGHVLRAFSIVFLSDLCCGGLLKSSASSILMKGK